MMERIWLKSYPDGVPADINPTAYASIGDFFAANVDRHRDRTAYVCMGGTMSYGALDRLSRAFAGYLQNIACLPRGARVALMMPNLLQYPVALFGALRAGYVVVNCNPLYSPRELHHQLADSGAEAIVVLENFAQTLEKAIEGTSVRSVAVTSVGDLLGGPRGFIANFVLRHIRHAVPAWNIPRAVRFNRALALGRLQTVEFPPVEPGDLAFLQYTGGTTGVPKGAMLTHRNMIANLQQVHAWVGASLGAAGEVFVTTLQRTPFTVITGVNTLFNALLANADFLKIDFSRLHLAIGGGMAVQRAVAERWKAVTGKPLIEGYGLTEASPIVSDNPPTIENYNGAIGLPMPSTDIAIRGADGRDVAFGEPGELCIKGPQVMASYWMRPDETAAVMTEDGYLRTGDIARVDERGYVFIVDRQKDMILVSGFNVYPNEIEDVVMTHPGVYEVGAVGVPDLKSGEAVKIVVVRKDESLTE